MSYHSLVIIQRRMRWCNHAPISKTNALQQCTVTRADARLTGVHFLSSCNYNCHLRGGANYSVSLNMLLCPIIWFDAATRSVSLLPERSRLVDCLPLNLIVTNCSPHTHTCSGFNSNTGHYYAQPHLGNPSYPQSAWYQHLSLPWFFTAPAWFRVAVHVCGLRLSSACRSTEHVIHAMPQNALRHLGCMLVLLNSPATSANDSSTLMPNAADINLLIPARAARWLVDAVPCDAIRSYWSPVITVRLHQTSARLQTLSAWPCFAEIWLIRSRIAAFLQSCPFYLLGLL